MNVFSSGCYEPHPLVNKLASTNTTMASSSELTVKLPSIESLKVTAGEAEAVKGERAEIAVDSQKLNRASTFMSRLQLGSLQRQRRPGDVWVGGVNRQPRPLGRPPYPNLGTLF